MISTMVATIDEWIPAEQMYADGTAPAGSGSFVTTFNGVQLRTWDFDQTTREAVWISTPIRAKTLAVDFYWTSTAGTGGVHWTAEACGSAPDTSLDVKAKQSFASDTRIADEYLNVAMGSRVQLGLPIGSLLTAQIARNPANAADTLTADARLIGVMLRWL